MLFFSNSNCLCCCFVDHPRHGWRKLSECITALTAAPRTCQAKAEIYGFGFDLNELPSQRKEKKLHNVSLVHVRVLYSDLPVECTPVHHYLNFELDTRHQTPDTHGAESPTRVCSLFIWRPYSWRPSSISVPTQTLWRTWWTSSDRRRTKGRSARKNSNSRKEKKERREKDELQTTLRGMRRVYVLMTRTLLSRGHQESRKR